MNRTEHLHEPLMLRIVDVLRAQAEHRTGGQRLLNFVDGRAARRLAQVQPDEFGDKTFAQRTKRVGHDGVSRAAALFGGREAESDTSEAVPDFRAERRGHLNAERFVVVDVVHHLVFFALPEHEHFRVVIGHVAKRAVDARRNREQIERFEHGLVLAVLPPYHLIAAGERHERLARFLVNMQRRPVARRTIDTSSPGVPTTAGCENERARSYGAINR
ncbi:hypothetical protein QCE81_35745 [Caballeronia sp. LZ002]|nr:MULTISPECIES: hypothetical protein [unclassified Caballeronia]MDR5777181.1 hypothetical protein [Caballeronia sp. LZ002]MDR5852594.1 hypothetical protein [Caballeronia sp. LZ003]